MWPWFSPVNYKLKMHKYHYNFHSLYARLKESLNFAGQNDSLESNRIIIRLENKPKFCPKSQSVTWHYVPLESNLNQCLYIPSCPGHSMISWYVRIVELDLSNWPEFREHAVGKWLTENQSGSALFQVRQGFGWHLRRFSNFACHRKHKWHHSEISDEILLRWIATAIWA